MAQCILLVRLNETGIAWCRLKEVLVTPEFRDWAKKHVVLLKIDFPRKKAQSDTEKARNDMLQRKYEIPGTN